MACQTGPRRQEDIHSGRVAHQTLLRAASAAALAAAFALAATGVLAAQAAPPQSAAPQTAARPLPDREVFLREVRKRLQTDDERQRDYIYTETRRRVRVDGQGRPTGPASVRVAESYPGLPGETRWERVLEDGGKRTSEADLRKQDAERQKKAEAFARRITTQTEADRRKAARNYAKRRAEQDALVDDVFRVYEMALLGREAVQGHDTIAVSLTPRQDAATRTSDGRWLKAFKGKAWVSESDFELVRLEVEAIRAVSVGLGLMAKMHQGTTVAFERRKVNDEVWLPARFAYQVSVRVLLLKGIRENGTSEYSGYRKFTVDTDQTFAPPAQ